MIKLVGQPKALISLMRSRCLFCLTLENPDIVEITGVHRFSDVGEERVLVNVHRNVIDEVIEVETSEAYESARALAKSDGILVGTFSGAAIWAATQLAKVPKIKGRELLPFCRIPA
jgi:cysteine synthase A